LPVADQVPLRAPRRARLADAADLTLVADPLP